MSTITGNNIEEIAKKRQIDGISQEVECPRRKILYKFW